MTTVADRRQGTLEFTVPGFAHFVREQHSEPKDEP
jgi:hypothetical protein